MVKIRSFNFHDIGELVDLMVAFHREENKLRLKRGDAFERRTTSEIYFGINYRGIEVLVAEDAGCLVGYAYLNTTNPEYPNALVIEEIYVKPEHRGKRIAGKITVCALLYAATKNIAEAYTEVKDTNAPNLRNNKRLGFEVERAERREFDHYLILHRKITTRKNGPVSGVVG